MTRFALVSLAALLLLPACGGEPIAPPAEDASLPCGAESDEAFCARVGDGACGELSGEDDCGETRTVSCPCPAVCGNGQVESGELCDGDCPASCDDQESCTLDTRTGSADNCNASCIHTPTTRCTGADGCCPSGCTSTNDSDCRPACGNGAIDPGESCDGDCPASCDDQESCTADARTGSASTCDARCTHTAIGACTGADGCCPSGCTSANDSDCRPACGNGAVDPGESCDGDCPASCADAEACTLDTSSGSASTCDLRCTHTAITACTGADGCCPSSCAFPADSDCPKSCSDDCAAENDRQCGDAGVERCTGGADGCLHWVATEQCAACADGACVDCSGACVRRVRAAAPAGGDGLAWSTAFRTVQEAIASAGARAEACSTSCQVWVAAGTYYLHGSSGSAAPAEDTVQLRGGVELYGGFAGSETALAARDLKANRAVLDGRDGPAGSQAVEHVVTGADGAVLDGFTVTGGRATYETNGIGGGYLGAEGSAEIRNCLFADNQAVGSGGAVATSAGSDRFLNCTFLRNRASAGGAAYASGSRGRQSFVNCTFSLNEATNSYQQQGGALHTSGGSIEVTNSILWKDSPVEYSVASGGVVTVAHSAVFRGARGATNLREDPKLRLTPEGLLALRSDSPCIDAGRGDQTGFAAPATDALGQARFDAPGSPNDGAGSPEFVDLGAIEYRGEATGPAPAVCVRRVDAGSTAVAPDGLSWASAFKSVQAGIDSAWSLIEDDPAALGCEVWVKEGTYRIYFAGTETVQLRPQVALLGGFAGNETAASQRDPAARPTILDGCYQVCTPDWRVAHVVTGEDYATLDGFTVTHGNAKAASGWDAAGGGMLSNGYCPEIRDCTFRDNIATMSGGGLYLDCGFEQRLSGLSFVGNYAQNGGGLHLSAAKAVVSDSLFQENYFSNWDGKGGALYAEGQVQITGTTFDRNHTANGQGGAIYGYYSRLELQACTFAGNYASPVGDGGAVYNLNGSVTATSCSFTDNSALNGHGGAICDSASANPSTCSGCAFSGNFPDDLYSY